MFKNVMNKFAKFLNGHVAVVESAPVPTDTPVDEVTYPYVIPLIDNGWDYQLPLMVCSRTEDPISGYPVKDLGTGVSSREITFTDGVTAETRYFFTDWLEDDVTANFTYDEYKMFSDELDHAF